MKIIKEVTEVGTPAQLDGVLTFQSAIIVEEATLSPLPKSAAFYSTTRYRGLRAVINLAQDLQYVLHYSVKDGLHNE